ncbi:MAG: hypothetical protein OXF20_14090 [Gammaproteobacteria bacterium]|nr:hypothetical protein [Gammaproteobacteria bacterium]
MPEKSDYKLGYSPPSPFKNVVEQQELQLQEPVSSRRLTGPVQFILGLLDCWKLEKKDAVYLLGFDETQSTCISEVFKGNEPLLDGQIPMDLLLKGSIVDILLVREYIESMVGR